MILDFIKSFKKSDMIFVLPIYSANENNSKLITSICRLLKKQYKNKEIAPIQGNSYYFKIISKHISNGDNIIFLGVQDKAQT